MLNLSDNFKAFLFNNQANVPCVRIVFEDLDTFEIDISEFIYGTGSLSKELQLQDGIYRPSSHNFTIVNTKDIGDYLFTLRKRYGNVSWVNKRYRIEYGYKKPVTPGATSNTEMITMYRGFVRSKRENRIQEDVSVDSQDTLKILNDFKFCTLNPASNVFDYSPSGYTSDTRGFQKNLRYGKFELIDSSTDVNGITLTNQTDPLYAMKGFPNLAVSNLLPLSLGWLNIPAGYAWYLPVDNFQSFSSTPYQTSNLKAYYWDYIADVWRPFLNTDFGSSLVILEEATTKNLFIGMRSGAYTVHLTGGATWANYVNGTGYFNVSGDATKIKMDVCIDHTQYLQDANPVRIIKDIIDTVQNETGYSLGEFDCSTSDFSSIDLSYTFDFAFQYMETIGAKINVRFDSTISALEVIQKIGRLCGLVLFVSSDYSSTSIRNIKIAIDRILNTCKDTAPFEISNVENAQEFIVETNSDELIDKVVIPNFLKGISSSNFYDLVTAGSGKTILDLSDNSSMNVYFYESHSSAKIIADKLYFQFSVPSEKYLTTINNTGIILEIGDYIRLVDAKINESIIAKIYRINFDLKNKIQIESRKYDKYFGPDQNIYKKYAFCGCAYAGTDRQGGNGISTGNISSGLNSFSLISGSFDLREVNTGMILYLGEEYFTITEVNSTTLLLDHNAINTYVNVDWSIGTAYFTTYN